MGSRKIKISLQDLRYKRLELLFSSHVVPQRVNMRDGFYLSLSTTCIGDPVHC